MEDACTRTASPGAQLMAPGVGVVKHRSVIRGTLVLCSSVYGVLATFALILFGRDTDSDVLANFVKASRRPAVDDLL